MFALLKFAHRSQPSTDATATAELSLHAIVQQALDAGLLSRQHYRRLTTAMLGVEPLPVSDRSQINRLFDAVRMGQIELVD